MKYGIMKIFIVAGWVIGIGAGCGREAPPEVPEYKIPPAIVFEESAVPEPPSLSGTPEAPPKPAPPPMPVKVQAPVQSVQKVDAPVAKPESSRPSLIGSWRVTEMVVGGQAMPMAAGMQITMTFAEGGSMTTNVSAPQMPQGKTDQGSYTLSNDQITMTSNNHSRTGTLRFEDPNRITLEMTEGNNQVRIVLTRM
jgi:hypothetical protein